MILLTGGSGQLGTELKKIIEVWAPTRQELDITKPLPKINADLIIHAAAYTNVNRAEEERELCYLTNVIGTRNLSNTGIPILYISTDSVFDGLRGNYTEQDIPYPKNFYSLSKLLGEKELFSGDKIIRCCLKTRPWAYPVACSDRFFSAEYVDQTAAKIAKAVKIFQSLPRIVHIGAKRRSHYEMALETRPDVKPIEGLQYEVYRGNDISLDCSLWETLHA